MNRSGHRDVPSSNPYPTSLASRRLAVLIVDPDARCAGQLANMLERFASVRVVESAPAAFAAMQAWLPDLIVTELDLPSTSGLELITKIYSTPATHNVLLLVTTTRTSVRDKIAAFQAGADDYLIKPIESAEFLRHVSLLCRFQQVIGR